MIRPSFEIAERACTQMRREVVRAGEEASLAERHVAENEAVLEMVERIRQLGSDLLEDDPPSEPWLTDWEWLVGSAHNR